MKGRPFQQQQIFIYVNKPKLSFKKYREMQKLLLQKFEEKNLKQIFEKIAPTKIREKKS